jgi:hypothetical protein
VRLATAHEQLRHAHKQLLVHAGTYARTRRFSLATAEAEAEAAADAAAEAVSAQKAVVAHIEAAACGADAAAGHVQLETSSVRSRAHGFESGSVVASRRASFDGPPHHALNYAPNHPNDPNVRSGAVSGALPAGGADEGVSGARAQSAEQPAGRAAPPLPTQPHAVAGGARGAAAADPGQPRGDRDDVRGCSGVGSGVGSAAYAGAGLSGAGHVGAGPSAGAEEAVPPRRLLSAFDAQQLEAPPPAPAVPPLRPMRKKSARLVELSQMFSPGRSAPVSV